MKVRLLTTEGSPTLDGALSEINKLGIEAKVVYAEKHSNPKTSYNISISNICKEIDDVLYFFEDDVEIRENEHLISALRQLPPDWEICYLGANLVAPIEKYSDNLYRTFGCWTTHAVIFNNPKAICEAYTDSSVMFDDWLKDNVHPRGNSYIIAPMIAWQKPHQSALWDHYADYREIFNGSANKLI
jgi:hypothetical protein